MFGKSDKVKTISPEEWVDATIFDAADKGASDIHFDPEGLKFLVRYRVDGILNVISEPGIETYGNVLSRLKVLGKTMDISTFRKPQDGRGQLFDQKKNTMLEFRISTFPTVYGEAVVVRFINQKDSIFESFEQMGMDSKDAEMVRDTIKKPHGMVLIVGPAGSGKTSTLYTALNYIRSPQKNIITLEDPVEFELQYIRHSQIRPEIGFTFSEGIKAILRQDPDVVFIGEIRDHESAEISVRAALSGRLVLSSISTNDSIGTITRFLEFGIPRSFLASSLLLTISKRLLRKNCEKCSEPYVPGDKLLKESGMTSLQGCNLLKGKGCDACGGRGYHGRVPVFEFFYNDRDIVNLIVDGAVAREIFDAARAKGMKTLREGATLLACSGKTTLEEAIYITE